MYERTLLSVDGFYESLDVLIEKEREVKGMFRNSANELLATEFGLTSGLDIPIEISLRMSKSKGSFSITESGEAKAIRLSLPLVLGCLVDNNFETALDTLKREVVHYALFKLGNEFADGTLQFESTIKRLGISSNVIGNEILPQYYIVDTYCCPFPDYHYRKETFFTKNERYLSCPHCGLSLFRTRTELFKYVNLPLV